MRDAQQTAVSGVAGAAASAMAVNFSGCTLTNQIDIAGKCVPSMTCAKVGAIIQGGSTGHVPTDTSPECTVTAGAFTGPFAGL